MIRLPVSRQAVEAKNEALRPAVLAEAAKEEFERETAVKRLVHTAFENIAAAELRNTIAEVRYTAWHLMPVAQFAQLLICSQDTALTLAIPVVHTEREGLVFSRSRGSRLPPPRPHRHRGAAC